MSADRYCVTVVLARSTLNDGEGVVEQRASDYLVAAHALALLTFEGEAPVTEIVQGRINDGVGSFMIGPSGRNRIRGPVGTSPDAVQAFFKLLADHDLTFFTVYGGEDIPYHLHDAYSTPASRSDEAEPAIPVEAIKLCVDMENRFEVVVRHRHKGEPVRNAELTGRMLAHEAVLKQNSNWSVREWTRYDQLSSAVETVRTYTREAGRKHGRY